MKDSIDNIMKIRDNNSVDMSISYNVRYCDENGKFVGIKYIVNINDTILAKMKTLPRQKLIQILVQYFDDEKRDWLANILLYYITSENAMLLVPFEPNKIHTWKKYRKHEDYRFWKLYD